MVVWSKENKPGVSDGEGCNLSREIIGILSLHIQEGCFIGSTLAVYTLQLYIDSYSYHIHPYEHCLQLPPITVFHLTKRQGYRQYQKQISHCMTRFYVHVVALSLWRNSIPPNTR